MVLTWAMNTQLTEEVEKSYKAMNMSLLLKVVNIGHLGRTEVERMWSLKAASRRSLIDKKSYENRRVKLMICKICRY